jgi:hypothetical protein
MESEDRFRVIRQQAPDRFARLADQARHDQAARRMLYERLSTMVDEETVRLPSGAPAIPEGPPFTSGRSRS